MERKIRKIRHLFKELKERHNLHEDEIIKHIKKDEVMIPLSIFNNDNLSILEAIVKYMREELNLKFTEIAKLLNRSNKTIWATYNNSKKKMKEKLVLEDGKFVPVSIFRARLLSVLESLVEFLNDKYEMRLKEIAKSINRDNRTVWCVHNRAVRKRKFA